jgi:hypothetical protein
MTLDEARAIVKEFCSHWTTQKICEVKAFAEDGNMHFHLSCQCLCGVATAENLHLMDDCPDLKEHSKWRWIDKDYIIRNPKFQVVERAYLILGYEFGDGARNQELLTILNALLAEREAAAASIDTNQQEFQPSNK